MAATDNGDRARTLVLSIGGSTLALMVALLMSVFQKATTSLHVAEQHGEELLLLRGEVASLRQEIIGKTADRYTAGDARADFKEVNERLYRLERLHDEDR